MNNHECLVDNENSNHVVEKKEMGETTPECSFWQNDTENACFFQGSDRDRDGGRTASEMIQMYHERYVKILDFRHFERHLMFSQNERKSKKKAISDGVNVSVVLELVSRNT